MSYLQAPLVLHLQRACIAPLVSISPIHLNIKLVVLKVHGLRPCSCPR